jgi:hypothetical protein
LRTYFDSYFGLQQAAGASAQDATLTLTDGEITITFAQDQGGWILGGPDGWGMKLAEFKGGGVYLNSSTADGSYLKHTVFDNVIETFKVGLYFNSPDDLIQRIDELSELLKVRAPRYWAEKNYNKPVYFIKQLAGESKVSYGLISQGTFLIPDTVWDIACTLDNGWLYPFTITLNRLPDWRGAIPGQVQDTVELSALQGWAFDVDWMQEDTLPTGQVFCMVELENGDIYAGGESEILLYTSGTWGVADTTPVTLLGDVTAALLLTNGDVLFGESGRIIKLSDGVWSVEATEPMSQVYALLETYAGEIYAGDQGRIIKRDTAGTWAEDDDLPDGDVFSFIQLSNGRVFAGESRRILRTVISDPSSEEIEVRLSANADNAEQYGSTVTVGGIEEDLDFFNRNYVGMRFQLDIPPGATINEAELELIARKDRKGSTETVRIYCEAADNAAAFTSATNDISSRSLTTKYKNWSTSKKWKRNKSYDSPDFAAVLQEVISRPGWTANNYVVVIVKSNTQESDSLRSTRREAYGYGSNSSKAPVLSVDYTVSPTAGQSWEVASTLPAGDVRAFFRLNNRIIAADDGQFLASHNNGQTWEVLSTTPTGQVLVIAQDDDGRLYAGEAGGAILVSADEGSNWRVDNDTLAAGDIAALLASSDGDIRAGDDGAILKLEKTSELDLGQEATDENFVFVANHHREANLTHIYINDGGVFSGIFPASILPVALLPAVPAVNDAVYFIIDTSVEDAGPFSGLVFNLSVPASSTGSYTIAWEVYTGSWTALTVQDNTLGFGEVGVNSVHWAMPSNWQQTTINGVLGWAIRARVSALTGTMTPPEQADRNIYSPCSAFAEIDADEISGTLDAYAKVQINNRSAGGGPGGGDPPLYANRIIVGVKAIENHETFRAFLNFSDGQNPEGVSVSTVDEDGATAIQTDSGLAAAVGERVFFDSSAAAEASTLKDRVSLILSTTVARDYYGSYRCFLRCKQNGGSAGQVSLRLKIASGTGGISFLTDTQYTQTTSDHHLIEFENPITLPVSSQFTNEDIGDETSITVQIASSSGSADVYLYDLFLLPVDVSYVDATDLANTATSAVDNEARLLVDSISVPKVEIRALAQKVASDLFSASWSVDSKGPFTLIKVQSHRIWLLSARTASAGSTIWISEPEVCHSVRAWKVDRWLLGRGLA